MSAVSGRRTGNFGQALDKISAELTRFIKLNRDKVAIAKVQFDVFGFSRGAPLCQPGDGAGYGDSGGNRQRAGHHGKAAGEVRFLGLFDTVAAIGSLLNLGFDAQRNDYTR